MCFNETIDEPILKELHKEQLDYSNNIIYNKTLENNQSKNNIEYNNSNNTLEIKKQKTPIILIKEEKKKEITCQRIYGVGSKENQNWNCSCNTWYVWDKNKNWKKQCVLWKSYCLKTYGINSEYEPQKWICQCKKGFYKKNGICFDYNLFCKKVFWENWEYNNIKWKCQCKEWTKFNWRKCSFEKAKVSI